MKALFGYSILFMAIGMILSYFVSGFCEFVLVTAMLVLAYVLLCFDC
ncbi:hypothetical protein [Eubacterium sp. MSJ-33]|nr:hypothetical protein [Eubacterium sp. MSJ-33]QWT53402.1 hypothetical protein KP625_01875 [Eubacterium sp. MSJ-33]